MALNTIQYISVTNSGISQAIPSTALADVIYVTLASNLVLVGDVDLTTSDIPPDGQSVLYIINGGNGSVDLNGRYFRLNGYDVTQDQLKAGLILYNVSNGTDFLLPIIINSQDTTAYTQALNGSFLVDESVTLAKIEDLARGNIIVGNSTNRPTAVDFNNSGYIGIGDGTDYNSVAQSGDVIFSTAGVSAIQAGVIVNADINASAAITRSKLASGTADYVVINSGAGVMSQEAQLANSRGGTGLDSSASTGFPTISSGTWSAAAIAIDRDLDVSWETGEVGDFKIQMGFAGTLVEIYEYVTKTLVTVGGTITPKNNAGTTMGSGTITHAAADPRGTANTATPTTNNTFIAGDILTFTTATATAGKAHLSLKFTRTA